MRTGANELRIEGVKAEQRPARAVGKGRLGLITLEPTDPVVVGLADLALFTILFTDGMRVGFRDLKKAWQLPGRALLLGMPLTLVGSFALPLGAWTR